MRRLPARLLLAFALFLASALRSAGTISASPAVPFPGRPVTFVLTASPDPFGQVQWSFGDGRTQVAGNIATATYAAPGSYTVRAVYRSLSGGGTLSPPQVAQAQVRVQEHPGGAFGISALRLRWEDSSTEASVPRGAPLVAFLDLKCEGAGSLQAEWTVDGVPVGAFVRQVAFAAALTVDSRDLPSLPTTELGEHQLSLRFLSPAVTFQMPVIRYFVRLGGEPPRIDGVEPARLRAGEEAELRLQGRNLTADMRLSFGKDIAILGPPQVQSPGRASVRIYLSPGARPGLRRVVVANPHGRARGPGSLQVAARDGR